MWTNLSDEHLRNSWEKYDKFYLMWKYVGLKLNLRWGWVYQQWKECFRVCVCAVSQGNNQQVCCVLIIEGFVVYFNIKFGFLGGHFFWNFNCWFVKLCFFWCEFLLFSPFWVINIGKLVMVFKLSLICWERESVDGVLEFDCGKRKRNWVQL